MPNPLQVRLVSRRAPNSGTVHLSTPGDPTTPICKALAHREEVSYIPTNRDVTCRSCLGQ